jgi:hypothetical protein
MVNLLMQVATSLRKDLDSLFAAPVLENSDGELSQVRAAAAVQAKTGQLVAAAVQSARSAGCTWQQIGDALGVSRQAAFQRFGKPIDPKTGTVMNTTPLPQAASIAESVIDDLAHARWELVVQRFDSVVTQRLNAEGLAAAWAQVIATVGAFDHHGEVKAIRAADVTITNTPLAFEAGDYVAHITFHDDASIAGLFILNPEVAR